MQATFQQSITRALKLSKREFEVLRLLVEGQTNPEIAATLGSAQGLATVVSMNSCWSALSAL